MPVLPAYLTSFLFPFAGLSTHFNELNDPDVRIRVVLHDGDVPQKPMKLIELYVFGSGNEVSFVMRQRLRKKI